jgi:hypothetical protein
MHLKTLSRKLKGKIVELSQNKPKFSPTRYSILSTKHLCDQMVGFSQNNQFSDTQGIPQFNPILTQHHIHRLGSQAHRLSLVTSNSFPHYNCLTWPKSRDSQDPFSLRTKKAMCLFFFRVFFFLKLLLHWGYTETFTEILTTDYTGIHLFHHSPLSPLPSFLE